MIFQAISMIFVSFHIMMRGLSLLLLLLLGTLGTSEYLQGEVGNASEMSSRHWNIKSKEIWKDGFSPFILTSYEAGAFTDLD